MKFSAALPLGFRYAEAGGKNIRHLRHNDSIKKERC